VARDEGIGRLNTEGSLSVDPDSVDPSTCPVCGYKTVSEDFDICPICFWERDYIQESDPDGSGANAVSLRRAQRYFREIGASAPSALGSVRPPGPDDERNPDWEFLDGTEPTDEGVAGVRDEDRRPGTAPARRGRRWPVVLLALPPAAYLVAIVLGVIVDRVRPLPLSSRLGSVLSAAILIAYVFTPLTTIALCVWAVVAGIWSRRGAPTPVLWAAGFSIFVWLMMVRPY
jgi:hypothetical protein